MSDVVAFPVIGLSNSQCYRKYSPAICDMTEKVVCIKLVGPSPEAASKRRLFKRDLILMYACTDCAKHFTVKHRKGFTSKVAGRITSGREEDSIFR